MKRLFYYSLITAHCLLLTGCFGSISDRISNIGGGGSIEGGTPISFEMDGSVIDLGLPAGWEEIDGNYPAEMIIAAQNLTQNFFVEQYPNYEPGIGDAIWEHQSQLFYHFKGIQEGAEEWQFEAQSSSQKPLRHYYQKILTIPGGSQYLIASCSREMAGTQDDCPAIMNSLSVQAPEEGS